MRSKSILLIIIPLLLTIAAPAQQANAQDPLMLSLAQGGFVAFVNRSEWIDLRQATRLRELPAPLGAQALPDTNQIIHRILRDRDGRFVFGYDLWISGDRVTKQFKIAIRPLDPRLAESLRPSDSLPVDLLSTFPKSTDPQTLKDGSEFSVDLLINKNAGVKFIDVVKVSFDRSSLGEDNPARRARDFSADAVAMEMKDYSLFINDELITTGKSKTGSSGALLWLYVPQRGRFILSLVPRSDYSFEKVGTISGNKIEFSIRGDRYEWLSSSPIMREEGTWNVWVLTDPKYLPLIDASMTSPAQEKGTLEKLEDKINAVVQRSPVTVQTPGTLQPAILDRMEKNTPRYKVMFGAADRIENLLPRN
jgi:hypothetical protein